MLHPLKAVLFIERDILSVLWHSLNIIGSSYIFL